MKIEVPLLFLFAFLFNFLNGQGTYQIQKSEDSIRRTVCLLTGISFGKNTFAEIGVSKNSNAIIGHHPFSSAYFASTELRLGEKFIIGPQIGGWIAGGVTGVAMGVKTIYYTDFDDGSLVFRPEIGFGFQNLKFVYSYNAILSKYHLNGLNRNLASIVYCFNLKKLNDKIRKR